MSIWPAWSYNSEILRARQKENQTHTQRHHWPFESNGFLIQLCGDCSAIIVFHASWLTHTYIYIYAYRAPLFLLPHYYSTFFLCDDKCVSWTRSVTASAENRRNIYMQSRFVHRHLALNYLAIRHEMFVSIKHFIRKIQCTYFKHVCQIIEWFKFTVNVRRALDIELNSNFNLIIEKNGIRSLNKRKNIRISLSNDLKCFFLINIQAQLNVNIVNAKWSRTSNNFSSWLNVNVYGCRVGYYIPEYSLFK